MTGLITGAGTGTFRPAGPIRRLVVSPHPGAAPVAVVRQVG